MTRPSLDETDLKLIKALTEDSRASVRVLASRLGMAPSTVHARLRRLIETGIITRFTILIDPLMLGFEITALTLIQADGSHIEDVEKVVASNPYVIAVYDITGEFDVAVIAKFRSISELDRFLKELNKLPYVRRTVTSIAMRVVKEDPLSIVSVAGLAEKE